MADIIKLVTSDAGEKLRPIFDNIAENGLPDNCEVIYKGPRNLLATLNQGTINVKQFGTPSFPNNFIYGKLRKSKARRSFEHAHRLLQLGFDTPLPYAYIEIYRRNALGIPMLRRSYYICRHLPLDNIRLWEGHPELPELVDQWGSGDSTPSCGRSVDEGPFGRQRAARAQGQRRVHIQLRRPQPHKIRRTLNPQAPPDV